ncbi:hypothetical protein DPMN_088178 [Dreissena polymorpha]|uniref:Uncharacterized protein n=1 Tax=Dreissena polymorpha TaxID=45954 RepID=A0A9D4KTP4_DREPO|nr:hypothetical protein DPMN_088178 [Dreissena polymorpha]
MGITRIIHLLQDWESRQLSPSNTHSTRGSQVAYIERNLIHSAQIRGSQGAYIERNLIHSAQIRGSQVAYIERNLIHPAQISLNEAHFIVIP